MSLDEPCCPPPSRHHRRHREQNLKDACAGLGSNSDTTTPQSETFPVVASGDGLAVSSEGREGSSTPSLMVLTPSGQLHHAAGNPGLFATTPNVAVVSQPSGGCASVGIQNQVAPLSHVFSSGATPSQVVLQQASPPQHFVVRHTPPQAAAFPSTPVQQLSVNATGFYQGGSQNGGVTQAQSMPLQAGMRLTPANSQASVQQAPCGQVHFVLQPQIQQMPFHVQASPMTPPAWSPQMPSAPLFTPCLRCGGVEQTQPPPPTTLCCQPSPSEPQMFIFQSPTGAGSPGVSAVYGSASPCSAAPSCAIPQTQTGIIPTVQPQTFGTVLHGQPVSCCYPAGTSAATMNVAGPKVALHGTPGMVVPSGGQASVQTVLPQSVVVGMSGMGTTLVEGTTGQPLVVYQAGTVLRDASAVGYPAVMNLVPPSIAALQAGHVFSRGGKKGADGQDGRKDRQQTGSLWCGSCAR
uniref:Uncharacterized protein n=1 Tax=Toxoplasma gondii COUG TaxID=1074873 RepID=A0A2G8Y048_TOXGO|nr:hypothetical protein TGCOUG_313780 [Toxoplasma gondii COUG]